MKVSQLLYVSKSSEKFTDPQIEDILSSSRRNNALTGITGILLYRGGLFLQLFEGDREKIQYLMDSKLKKDDRHAQIVEIFFIDRNERIFGEWSMEFREVSDLDIRMVNEMLSWNGPINAAKNIDNHLVLHMLERFKDK